MEQEVSSTPNRTNGGIMQFRQQGQTEIRPWQHGVIFLAACLILISRRPDAVFNAQFWAEDGHVWFADAYNFGWWSALFRTCEGYHSVFARLGAALALLVPLAFAPLVLNLIAISVQALPVNLLLSSRSSVWGSLRFRALLAGIYLASPSCFELDGTITNSQWLLALCAFLLLAASPPQGISGRLFDISILLLCGLTGPFCIFLTPIAVFLAWRHRERWRWATAGLLAATGLIQAWSLFSGGYASRPHVLLGASPAMLARVLAGQLYLGTLLGSNTAAVRPGIGPFIVFTCIAVAGTIFAVICFLKSSWEMRLFVLFSAAILAGGLIAPAPGPLAETDRWWLELLYGAGVRYWFFPDLALAWLILYCTQSRRQVLQAVSVLLLCILCFGIAIRWEIPAFRDAHFAEYAKSFEAAPPGTVMVIPINPEGWKMRLVKHASLR